MFIAGRIFLKISWTKLASVPVVVTLEDVLVVVGPKEIQHQVDEAVLRKQALDAKLEGLCAWEAFRFPGSDFDEKEPGHGAKLVERVMDNLQVVVKRVHVRYEHSAVQLAGAASAFSFGLCIEEFSATSTDAAWHVLSKSAETPTTVFRNVQLQNFAVYLNSSLQDRSSTISARSNAAETVASFPCVFGPQAHSRLSYLLPPVNGYAHLIMKKQSLLELASTNGGAPQLHMEIELDSFGLTLDRPQYLCVISLLALVATAAPSMPASLESSSSRKSTDEDRDAYIGLYKRKLSGYKNLSVDDETSLRLLEIDLSFGDVVRFRTWALQIAALELGKSLEQIELRTKEGSSWKFWRSKEVTVRQVTTEEREEIFRDQVLSQPTVDYQKGPKLPSYYVKTLVDCRVAKIFVQLTHANRTNDAGDLLPTPLMSLALSTLSATYRARTKGMLVDATIGDLELHEHVTAHSLFPFLLCSFDRNCEKSRVSDTSARVRREPFLGFTYEVSPLDDSCDADSRIVLRTERSDIVINPQVIASLREFFESPPRLNVEELRAQVAAHVTDFADATRQRCITAMQTRTRQLIDFRLSAPTLIVPRDPADPVTPVLVLDMGMFSVLLYGGKQ